MVANWMTQLDHMTRGRVMLGVGPGALPGDAYMMGIDPTKQRIRMDESLGVIMRLFKEKEPITHHSDWFELQEAMLQLRPYQTPHMPISVASVQTPSGVALAGKHGASVLTITTPRDPAAASGTDLKELWDICEESAAEHNQVVDRFDWRLVLPVHLADTREEAFEQARIGAGRYQREYFEHTMGRPQVVDGPPEKIIDVLAERGAWIIGTPDDCIEGIKRLEERSGGFGAFMVQTVDWASREHMMHSYELIARHVMPHFQGSADAAKASNQWAYEHNETLMAGRTRALDRAHEDYAARSA
jgi:limonene 1,2-monooxygenase